MAEQEDQRSKRKIEELTNRIKQMEEKLTSINYETTNEKTKTNINSIQNNSIFSSSQVTQVKTAIAMNIKNNNIPESNSASKLRAKSLNNEDRYKDNKYSSKLYIMSNNTNSLIKNISLGKNFQFSKNSAFIVPNDLGIPKKSKNKFNFSNLNNLGSLSFKNTTNNNSINNTINNLQFYPTNKPNFVSNVNRTPEKKFSNTIFQKNNTNTNVTNNSQSNLIYSFNLNSKNERKSKRSNSFNKNVSEVTSNLVLSKNKSTTSLLGKNNKKSNNITGGSYIKLKNISNPINSYRNNSNNTNYSNNSYSNLSKSATNTIFSNFYGAAPSNSKIASIKNKKLALNSSKYEEETMVINNISNKKSLQIGKFKKLK